MTRQSYLDALLAGAAILVSAGAAGAADHPDFTGLWRTPTFIAALKTAAGRAPPQRPEAKVLYDERLATAARKVDDPVDDCAPRAPPRLTYAPYPLLILQEPEPDDSKWLGRSVAHWDGQTLVVETFDLDDRAWPDQAGLPRYGASGDAVVRSDGQPGMPLQERVCPRDHEM